MTEAKPAITVSISENRMRAFLTLPRPAAGGPYPYTEDDIYEALTGVGVESGVLLEEIEDLVAKERYVKRHLVAEGTPPVHGTDARLEFIVEIPESGRPQEKDYDRVDYRDLGMVVNVKAGQVLARKTPATMGEAGINVIGRPIPPRNGRDFPLSVGRGAAFLEANPLEVVATIDGQFQVRGFGRSQRISVEQTFTVNGDVDFSVGNLEVDGKVVVHGNVRSSFEVKATSDIDIHGFVEDATLESGGDVQVRRGAVSGPNRAKIVATGDVHLQFADRTDVITQGDIYVDREAVRCNFQADGAVFVGAERSSVGDIVAGTIDAGREIRVVNVGSGRGVVTRLRVGEKPSHARKRREVRKEMEQSVKNLTMVNTQIRHLEGQKDAYGKLPPDRAELLARLMGVQEVLEEQTRQQKSELAAFSREGGDSNPRVLVSGQLSAWTEVTIKGCVRMFTEPLEQVLIDLTGDGSAVVATALGERY